MKLRALSFGALAMVLASCATAPAPEVERRASFAGPLPPMRTFGAPRVSAPSRSNAQIAQDFLDLSFEMESGRKLPILTKFDEPVTVALRGPATQSLTRDLTKLLERFRREAGIDVRLAPQGAEANLVIEVLPRRELQRVVPQAACFVVPRVGSWEEFKKARRSKTVDWTTLTRRTRAAVFLPGDVSPQESRDCLHEELAQALGPLNDLYRLPESVFNDDNFHTVLTGFDMLMLRIYYDGALKNGMTREQVEVRLPAILARLNPAGQRNAGVIEARTPRAWIDAIEKALGPRTSAAQRRASAKRAVEIAEQARWRDTRRAFSLYALGRLSLNEEPELALASFLEAAAIYRSRPDTAVQAAHVNMQLAAFSLSAGQANSTLALVNESLPAVTQAENAALLATLMMLQSEALKLKGQTAEATRVRNEALGWARYGFGRDEIVRARAGEIATLAPGPVGG